MQDECIHAIHLVVAAGSGARRFNPYRVDGALVAGSPG